jgi:WD40 repeat protein
VRYGPPGRDGPGGSFILRNNDNRFSKSLETPVVWSPEPCSTDLEFSIDGTVLIGIGSGQCRVWNAGNGETLRSIDGIDALEIVGMPTNAHVLFHDPSGERLVLVDVTSGHETPRVVAAVSTDGRLCRKWTERRLRISPRGGAVIGATEDRELRLYSCHNMASVKRQTTLQIMKSQTSAK